MSQPPYSGDWNQPPQPQGPPGGPPQPPRRQEAGFFKALFDFSFRSFIMVKFAAVIYVIALVILGIGGLLGIISAFITMTESVGGGLLVLLGVLVGIPFYLILIRITLEFYVAMVRTALNTGEATSEVKNLRWDLSQKG